MGNVPLDQDEAFLTAVKTELLSLRKRVRHETLQKLELLKQIKEYREKESLIKLKSVTVVASKVDCAV